MSAGYTGGDAREAIKIPYATRTTAHRSPDKVVITRSRPDFCYIGRRGLGSALLNMTVSGGPLSKDMMYWPLSPQVVCDQKSIPSPRQLRVR